MNKNYVAGIAMVLIGIATLAWQLNRLHETGSFFVLGVLSSAFIVMGIAAFFIDVDDFQEDDGFGNKSNKSFGDMGMPQKATVVLALLAAAAQFAYFKFGSPLIG